MVKKKQDPKREVLTSSGKTSQTTQAELVIIIILMPCSCTVIIIIILASYVKRGRQEKLKRSHLSVIESSRSPIETRATSVRVP